MNLRDLKYLVAVADYKHFGKAAAACFVSQPTLSAQLKKLEDEFGMRLFERSNKKILITPIGESIIAQARVVLREAAQLKELAKQAQDPLAGRFKLGVIPTLGPYLLPHILSPIKKQLPNLELFLFEEKTAVILNQLEKGMLDAAILALPVNTNNLITKELFKEPFWVVMPKQHALARQKKLHLDDLAQENLLLLEDGHCLRDQALTVCQRVNLEEKTDYRASSLETLRHMVGAGHGITFLPTLALQKDNLVTVKCIAPHAPVRNVGMIWRKNCVGKKVCEAIEKIISDTMPAILKQTARKLT